MTESQRQGWSFVGFPIAGLLSGLLFVGFSRYFDFSWFSTSLAAAVFGTLNAFCMYYFFSLYSGFRRLLFVFVAESVFAWVSSVWVATIIYLLTPDNHPPKSNIHDPSALFSGGFVGAFILLGGALRLMFPSIKLSRAAVTSFSGALIGGLLGICRSSDVWGIVIWQTGMSFILCLGLWSTGWPWLSPRRKNVPKRSSRTEVT